MRLELSPEPDPGAAEAVARAVTATRPILRSDPVVASAWLHAGLLEACDRSPGTVRPAYADSPRSTRGATRA